MKRWSRPSSRYAASAGRCPGAALRNSHCRLPATRKSASRYAQPIRNRDGSHAGERGAGERPQRHPRRDDQRLEKRHPLPEQRVGQHQRGVDGAPEAELAREEKRRPEAGGLEDRRDGDGRRRREPARGERPEPLDRMRPVALAVRDVVDEVDAARDHAEDRDAGRGEGPARPARRERTPNRNGSGTTRFLTHWAGRAAARSALATPPEVARGSAGVASPGAGADIYAILKD